MTHLWQGASWWSVLCVTPHYDDTLQLHIHTFLSNDLYFVLTAHVAPLLLELLKCTDAFTHTHTQQDPVTLLTGVTLVTAVTLFTGVTLVLLTQETLSEGIEAH